MAAKKTTVVRVATDPNDPYAGAPLVDPGLVAPPSFLSTPAATGPGGVQIPSALQAPDPYAGAAEATVAEPPAGPAPEPADPYAGAPVAAGVHTPDTVKSTDTAALVADKDFRPVEWLAANEQQALADPALLQKVQDVYEQRYKNQKGAVRSFVENLAPSKLVPATVGVAKGLGAAVAEPFAVLGRAAGRASAGDLKGAAGEVAAAPQAVAEAGTRDVNLAFKGLRGLQEAQAKGAVLPPTLSIPLALAGKGAPQTPEDFRNRMLFDVELQKQEDQAKAGNSDLAKFLGTDSESLAKAGVTVNPEAVEKLSVVADPVNFVPIGAAVGAVSKAGKFAVASVASAEAAEKLATALNTAVRVPGAVAGTLTGTLGKLAESAGAAAAKAGKTVRTAPLGGSIGTLARGAGLGAEVAGKTLEVTGKAAKAAAPVLGNIVTEGLKGGLEAGAVTFPLTIGASDDEREALMGNIGLAAGLRPAVGLAGAALQAGGNAARNAVAARIYKSVERPNVPPSLAYGTDPRLDIAHQKQMELTPDATKNVINYFREFFKPAGVEIYAMNSGDFTRNVDKVGGAERAKGFFVHRGERINADGTQTPVNQIFLNGGADAIGHELYHAFEDIDPIGATALKDEISKTWTPDEQKQWAQTYNSALNGGLPESQWTRRLSDEELKSEAAAEIFGRVLEATDLTGTKDSVQNKAAHLLANGLEKVGFPLGGARQAAGPGVSELGIRPTASQFAVAKQFLGSLASRVKENGSVIGGVREPVTLKELQPGEISRRQEPPSAPPAAPAAEPAPTPAPPAPAAPAAAQAPAAPLPDVAAKRAAVTNADQATAAAAKMAPETQKVVQDVNAAVGQGQTAFELEHIGVKSAGGREVQRTPRRTEQEAAYIAESQGALPQDVRDQHQKVSSFLRWEFTKDGTPQFVGYSLDKALANIEHLVRWSKEKGVAIPYENTPESYRQATQDLKDYYNNQAHGYRGDGETLVRPTEDIQVSLPPEDPNYTPVKLSPEKTQFLNAAQGTQLGVPLTVREQRGKIPGNIKAQLLAEAQGRTPQATADITVQKEPFKTKVGGRTFSIKEVNPLRNEMVKAGVPVRQLIEATERLNADNIVSAKPRPDIGVAPGVTDITRGGFLPSRHEDVMKHAIDTLNQSPEEFAAKMRAAPGGLTGEAFKLGQGLENRESLDVLKKSIQEAKDRAQVARNAKDVDGWLSYANRSQYFREALEAATGTGGSGEMLRKNLGDAYQPPFPETAAPAGKFAPSPAPNEDVRKTAQEYAKGAGIDYRPKQDYVPVNDDLAKRIADAYETAKDAPNDPAVKASYEALAKETVDQYNALKAQGYTIEPYEGKGEPYKNSGEMLADVRDNKHLYFLRTEEALAKAGADNPMLAPSGVTINGHDLPVNDVFRAVHDFYGHAKEGYAFGPRGELNAWRVHDELYSPAAKGALAAETLGQNSWVNYGKHLRTEEGKLPAKGETGYKPLTERPFAEQKNILLPDELVQEARTGGEGKFSPSVPSDETVKNALSEDKKPFVGAHRDLPEGTPVGLRIDIPAFTRKGAYVVTVHEKAAGGKVGKRLGYDSIATVDNPTFFSNETGAEKIRGGAAKFPIATVEGEFNHAREVPSGPEWTEVGFNPTKHSYFYDKETDQPVVSGDQAVSVGNSVFVKNAEFGNKEDFKFLPAKAKQKVAERVTGWILPNAEFKDLGDTTLHERFLAKNYEDLNKRFGTNFDQNTDEGERVDALNKGFVRIRSDDNGNVRVEAAASGWTPRIKKRLLDHLLENADDINQVKIQLLNPEGTPVDSHTENFFTADDPGEAAHKVVDAVRPAAGKGTQFGAALPTPGSSFLPASPEVEAARDAARTKAETVKRENPEALVPEYKKDENGDIFIDKKGLPKIKAVPYNFEESPGAKAAMKGKQGDKVRFDAATDAAADKLVGYYDKAKTNPEIKAGEEWYSKARKYIKEVFGDQSQMFAQLLAATSARTDVESNYRYAIEAINNFNQGKYDRNIAKYNEGLENFAKGEVDDMVQATGNEDPNRAQYMDWWIEKHDLSPVRENQKLFGANSRHVLRVLAGNWTGSRKTQQFYGNLSGKSFEATIDVWAARAIHRALNEDFGGRWRILPKAEKAPTPAEFEFAQVAFRKAAKRVGIQPDALQAILWFNEKDHYLNQGWTSKEKAGGKKGDFNVNLARTTKEGPVYVVKKAATPQTELNLEVTKK